MISLLGIFFEKGKFPREERMLTSSFIEEGHILGRESDKRKIVNMLTFKDLNCTRNFEVISLVGIIGVGKTTLA